MPFEDKAYIGEYWHKEHDHDGKVNSYNPCVEDGGLQSKYWAQFQNQEAGNHVEV